MFKNKMNIWGENTCNIFNKKLVSMDQWEKDNNPNEKWANSIMLGGSVVKNTHAMERMQVQSLSQEDPLEKEMVIYTCILAWRIPRTEEPGWLQSMGSQESDNLAM